MRRNKLQKLLTFVYSAAIPVYIAVAGGKASIPCNVTTPLTDDKTSLILWYRADVHNPIYTLDVRKKPIKTALHFPSAQMEGRAYFDVSIHPPVLILFPVRVEDEAEYKCRVDLRRSRTLILHSRLNVIVPPGEPIIMDGHGKRLRGVIGPYKEKDFVSLACEVDGGDPSPEVTWWRDSVLTDDTYNVTAQGFIRNEMYLWELQRSDLMAEYRCQATNTNLTKPRSSAVALDINLKPLDVKIGGLHRPLSAGVKRQIYCETTGSRPRAYLSWWLEREKLAGALETVSEGGNLTVSTLPFTATPDDNGKLISCRAENPSLRNSTIDDKWTLEVHYPPAMSLTLGANVRHTVIKEGSNLYLECTVEANPWITELVWEFEDEAILSNRSAGVIISNQTLTLQSVRKDHRGRYRCLSANSEGKSSSNYLHLLIQFAPVCKLPHPKIYGVAKHEVMNVTCEVEADPPEVSFRWSMNNSKNSVPLKKWLSEGSRSVLSYSPSSVDSYGILLCWAINIIGEQREPCKAKVIPAGAPESPRDCSVINQTSYSLSVECEPGYDGGLPQTFHLELYNSVVDHLTVNLTKTGSPVFTVQRLPPSTAFVLVIYAANGKGRSNAVALMASTTAPAKRTANREPVPASPLLGILIGVIAVFVILAATIVIIVILRGFRYLEEKDVRAQEENQSCEVPLKKDIQDMQDTNEKGPDIIPLSSDSECSSEQLKNVRHLRNLPSQTALVTKDRDTDTCL